LDFITFDDLLGHLERIITRVIDITLEDPIAAEAVKKYNPDFTKPTLPFMRMRYTDAIDWLVKHGIKNEEGEDHKFGDDIAEAAERKMTDAINRPIFLTHFPVCFPCPIQKLTSQAPLKSFYMPRAEDDNRVTESVDVLMPGVGRIITHIKAKLTLSGEVVGGSMRSWDWEELMAGYKREGIDPAPYFWYTDQRKYGSTPHGGYGLGLERYDEACWG
jgi:asparaginyl-tRNA synthetase